MSKNPIDDIIYSIIIVILCGLVIWSGYSIYKKSRPELEDMKQRQTSEEQNIILKPTRIGTVLVSVYIYEGHEYIIADGGYGCCIIHSESCRCKDRD